MGKFKIDQQVLARGVVVRISDCGRATVLLRGDQHCYWVHEADLELVPEPVMVKCSLSLVHPLTDIKTARARAEALDISFRGVISPDEFVRICAELAKKDITPQQFVEGLT